MAVCLLLGKTPLATLGPLNIDSSELDAAVTL
jgi:hypothetical protein